MKCHVLRLMSHIYVIYSNIIYNLLTIRIQCSKHRIPTACSQSNVLHSRFIMHSRLIYMTPIVGPIWHPLWFWNCRIQSGDSIQWPSGIFGLPHPFEKLLESVQTTNYEGTCIASMYVCHVCICMYSRNFYSNRSTFYCRKQFEFMTHDTVTRSMVLSYPHESECQYAYLFVEYTYVHTHIITTVSLMLSGLRLYVIRI